MSRGHGLANAFRPVPAVPPGACLTGRGRDVGRRGRGARSSGDGGTTRRPGRSAWLAWCWVGAGFLVSGGRLGGPGGAGVRSQPEQGWGMAGPAGARVRGPAGLAARAEGRHVGGGSRSPPRGAWRGGDAEPRGWARTRGGGAAAGRAGAEAESCVGAARSTLIPGGGSGRGRPERVRVRAPSIRAGCPHAGLRAARPRGHHLFCGIPTDEDRNIKTQPWDQTEELPARGNGAFQKPFKCGGTFRNSVERGLPRIL